MKTKSGARPPRSSAAVNAFCLANLEIVQPATKAFANGREIVPEAARRLGVLLDKNPARRAPLSASSP